MIVNIAIGNSDGKLTQEEWSYYWHAADYWIRKYADEVHGAFLSLPNSKYQNASWTVNVRKDYLTYLKQDLAVVRTRFQQDSIAWLSGETEFI